MKKPIQNLFPIVALRLITAGFLLGGLFACDSSPDTVTSDQQTEPAYLNPELPVDTRVNDLVGRMTLDEKIAQMVNQAPAIERLGVPEYNWWSEGLHGVARAGLATVFPQAIGLAAMWDEEEMFNVATAIPTKRGQNTTLLPTETSDLSTRG